MRKKLSLIFLLLGGILTIIGATLSSVNMKKTPDKEEIKKEEKSLDKNTYMPITYQISDNVYLVPNFSLGDSNILNISDYFFDLIKDKTLAVQFDDTNIDQLDYAKNYILESDDYLDNHITNDFKNKLINFSIKHTKYNYDDYKHYNIGFNYEIINNIAYIENGFNTSGIKNILIDKYNSSKKEIISLEDEDIVIDDLNKPKGEEFINLINDLIDNYDNYKEKYLNNYNNYINGNTKELDKYCNELNIENEYFNNKIIIRNERLFDKIIEYVQSDEEIVMVVDIENVYGDNGLLRMLSDFKVKEIKEKN